MPLTNPIEEFGKKIGIPSCVRKYPFFFGFWLEKISHMGQSLKMIFCGSRHVPSLPKGGRNHREYSQKLHNSDKAFGYKCCNLPHI
jgi:hypothetical protein